MFQSTGASSVWRQGLCWVLPELETIKEKLKTICERLQKELTLLDEPLNTVHIVLGNGMAVGKEELTIEALGGIREQITAWLVGVDHLLREADVGEVQEFNMIFQHYY